MATGLKELRVWQEGVLLAADTIRAARQSSRREVAALTDQIMLTAVAIPARIADGHGRYAAAEQRQSYRQARRALLQLETHLAVARHAELISATVLVQLSSRANSVSRLLTGYLTFIERQLSAEAAVRSEPEPLASSR